MKFTTIIGALLIIFIFTDCQNSKNISLKNNDLNKESLKGKVKSIKTDIYKLIQEKDTFKIGEKINEYYYEKDSYIKFNEAGNYLHSKDFYSNGKVKYEKIYTYDKKGRLIRRKEIDHYGKGSYQNYDIEYNSKDSIIKWTVSNDVFKRIYKIFRDKKNRAIKGEVIQNDTIRYIYKYKYDDNDSIISENVYNTKEKRTIKEVERIFNKEKLKKIEKITEYHHYDTFKYYGEFIYNTNKKIIEEKNSFNGIKNNITYSYYPNGILKTFTINDTFNGSPMTITNRYNKNGDLIEIETLNKNSNEKTIQNYRYKYDNHNNWIEKIGFKDNVPIYIVKRTITYYDN